MFALLRSTLPLQSFHKMMHFRCPWVPAPSCPPITEKYRTFDGSCNNARYFGTNSNTSFQHLNPRDSNFGRTGTPFQRILLPEYARGTLDLPRKSSVDNSQLPSARDISNALSQGSNRVDTANTVLVMQVGRRTVSKFYIFSSDGPVHRSRHHPHSKPWNSVLRSKRSVPSVSAILFSKQTLG